MKSSLAGSLTLTLLACLALAACGSSTRTVSAGAPEGTATTTTTETSPAPTTTTGSTSTGASGSAGSGGAQAPSQNRTAPEPEFAHGESASQEAQSAAATVKGRGYTPNDLAEYHPNQTLRVLVGTRTGSADGYAQQAFFFVDGRYIGTDASEPSAAIKVVSQNDTEAVIAYQLYRPGDPLSSPSGGHALVRFQLDNGKLTPVGKIPPSHSSTAASRL